MVPAFDVQLPGGRTLFGLIGWFSLCMIIAGAGAAIEPAIRSIWALAGAAGISAALVLEGGYRRQHSHDFGQQPFGTEACMKPGI